MRIFHGWMLSILIAAGLAAASPALAQSNKGYPSRPIRLVSGYPAGGINDIVARTIGIKLSERLSTPVVVDNRPGAAGSLASTLVSRAEPDGYTLMVYSSGFAITAALRDNLPFDPIKDFAGVARIGPITQAVIVSPSSGINSIAELVARAKAQPGKVLMASSGAGSGSHLIGEKIRVAAGIKVVHVGFKGNTDMLIQLAGGRVHFGISAIGAAMPLVRDGKLKIIAVTTSERSSVLPNVPTIEETLPKFKHEGAFGVLAPAKTPRNTVNLLNKEINQILVMPDVSKRLTASGIVPSPSTPKVFEDSVREEIETFTKLAREIGLRRK